MAVLSTVPGRLRVEAMSLIGNKAASLFVEAMLLSRQGVQAASGSHRTGRVLVLFDEGAVSRSEVEGQLAQVLQAAATHETQAVPSAPVRRPSVHRQTSTRGAGPFGLEMALHALLPAPLDLLLPTAVALRR